MLQVFQGALNINDMISLIQDLVKMVCDERCDLPHKTDQNESRTKSHRRHSTKNCTEDCLKHYANNKETLKEFPCLPGCADSIFEARYWLGQQDTVGTDEYSAIHCLRSQFRRLSLGKCP